MAANRVVIVPLIFDQRHLLMRSNSSLVVGASGLRALVRSWVIEVISAAVSASNAAISDDVGLSAASGRSIRDSKEVVIVDLLN